MKSNNHDLTWEEIEKYLDKDSYKEFLSHISPTVFAMAGYEQNRSRIVKTVLKILQERDPQNATEAYAQKIVDAMQKVAKRILEHKKNSK